MKRVIVFLALSAIALFSLSCEEAGDGGAFSYPHPDQATWVYGIDVPGIGTLAYQDSLMWTLDGTYDHPTAGTVQWFDNYTYDETSDTWEYDFSYYLLVTNDEVRFYYDDTSSYYTFLKMPLKVGDEWQVSAAETAKVLAQENVTVPVGTFNNCYKIQYSLSGSPYMNLWFPSGVGGWGVQIEWIGLGTFTLSLFNLPS